MIVSGKGLPYEILVPPHKKKNITSNNDLVRNINSLVNKRMVNKRIASELIADDMIERNIIENN